MTKEQSSSAGSPVRPVGSALSGRERLARAERTASRTIDGRAVVISIDHNRVHVLNDVGTHVWESCDGRTLDAIARDIVEQFDVDLERAARDVRAFAALLVEVGAAELSAAEE
jgi:hypothetical protein